MPINASEAYLYTCNTQNREHTERNRTENKKKKNEEKKIAKKRIQFLNEWNYMQLFRKLSDNETRAHTKYGADNEQTTANERKRERRNSG